MSAEPTTVWMVHKDVIQAGVRGDLMLDEDRLIFRPEIRGARPDVLGETVVPLSQVRKVSRARGSPVLELHVSTEGLPPVLLFYFVKPPDMYSSGMLNPRAAVATHLANAGAIYQEEIETWVVAVREAIRERGHP